MNVTVIKALCAAGLFIFGLVGTSAARVVKGTLPNLMALCNAVAGGVLIGVAVVHMLSENSEQLEGWGKQMMPAFGVNCEESCDAFPLGFALFVAGAFLILAIEVCGAGSGHSHGHSHGVQDKAGEYHGAHHHDNETSDDDARAASNDDSEDSADIVSDVVPRTRTARIAGKTAASVVSASTAVGVSTHSFIEAAAMGSSTQLGPFLSLLFAVLLHKGFTAFAVGSALAAQESRWVWMLGSLFYSIAAPSGIVTGILLTKLEGPVSAALQCFAAGTLLTIGMTDMLLPSVSMEDASQRRCNLAASFAAATATTSLAAWV